MVQTREANDVEGNDVKKSKGKPSDGWMEALTVKVDPDLKEQVQSVAEQDGKTPSEVCREILEKALSGNPDRQRSALLRSLAITKSQMETWLSLQKPNLFGNAKFHRLIGAIERVESALKAD